MQTEFLAQRDLDPGQARRLYAFRHHVFVDRLGWDLPGAQDGLEIDQFDREDTIYILGRDSGGDLWGCARLLRTSGPFLLGEVFPQLMAYEPLPCSDDVWEISRFCSLDLERRSAGASRRLQTTVWGCRQILAATVECALQHQARRLIAVSAVSVEKILQRLGVDYRRTGPDMDFGEHKVFGFWLELNTQTLEALGVNFRLYSS